MRNRVMVILAQFTTHELYLILSFPKVWSYMDRHIFLETLRILKHDYKDVYTV